MCFRAFDLGTYADFLYLEVTCPGFDGLAELPSDVLSTEVFANHQSTNDDGVFGLQVAFRCRVDPAYYGAIEFGDEDCTISERRKTFDPSPHFVFAAFITKLSTQFGGSYSVLGFDPSNLQGIHSSCIITASFRA